MIIAHLTRSELIKKIDEIVINKKDSKLAGEFNDFKIKFIECFGDDLINIDDLMELDKWSNELINKFTNKQTLINLRFIANKLDYFTRLRKAQH